MADEARHAAWHQTGFAVRLLAETEDPTDLASGLPDLGAATDFAFEWLNREDPGRTGTIRIVIDRVDEAGTETVLTYPPEDQQPERGLVDLFGYDPTTWRPQNLNRPAKAELRRRLPVRDAAPPPATDGAGAAPPRDIAPVGQALRVSAPVHAGADAPEAHAVAPTVRPPAAADRPSRTPRPTDRDEKPAVPRDWVALRRRAEAIVRSSWDDTASRALLAGAAFSLWCMVAMLEPVFLVFALAMLSALWMRQRQRLAIEPDDDYF